MIFSGFFFFFASVPLTNIWHLWKWKAWTTLHLYCSFSHKYQLIKLNKCLYCLYFTPCFTGAHIISAISTAMPFTIALVDTSNSYNMGFFFSLISSYKKQNGFWYETSCRKIPPSRVSLWPLFTLPQGSPAINCHFL